MWLLPLLLLAAMVGLSIPLSKYATRIMGGQTIRLRACCAGLKSGSIAVRKTGSSTRAALLVFNAILFVYGFIVLAIQPLAPLNPRGLGMLGPTTIFQYGRLPS